MTIRIGVLAPLSPPGWVDAGENLLAGMRLAVDEVNQSTASDSTRIELIVRDTAADPARAQWAVDELAGMGVAALAGEYHSVVARAVAARADALGVPFLCSSAVLDQLTDEASDWVARIAPPQSRGWDIYADYVLGLGHRRIAVVAQPSVYWQAGTRLLRDRFATAGGVVTEYNSPDLSVGEICEAVVRDCATMLVLLVGLPEPASALVRAVRADARLDDLLIGAPAGQPELPEWNAALGASGAAVPFLRYLPEALPERGARVDSRLREHLGNAVSFVAFEGYDTVTLVAELLQQCGPDRAGIARALSTVSVDGTRGRIRFDRAPRLDIWQWASAPIQVADRDRDDLSRFRVLHVG